MQREQRRDRPLRRRDREAQAIAEVQQQHGQGEVLVMSFHGVPEQTLRQGDPYHCECHKTARLLAERLGLSRDEFKVTFQSRFGKAKWLEPYTEPTLRALAKKLLAVETTAHPTDGELLDHARRLFKRLDRLQPNSPPFGSAS